MKRFLTYTLVLFLVSCEDIIYPDLVTNDPILVVDAWVNNKNETQIGRTFLYIRENIQSLTIKIKRIEYYRKDPIELQKKSFKSVEKVMNNKFNTDFFINQGKNLSSNKQTHTLNIP